MSFFNMGNVAAADDLEVKSHDEDVGSASSSHESWHKVTPRKRKHIELKDLTENDFVSLIEAKN